MEGRLVVGPQEEVDVLGRDPARGPERPRVHHQARPLEPLPLGPPRELLQQRPRALLVEVDLRLARAVHRLVPVDEELLVVVVDVREVRDAQPLQLLLHPPHLPPALLVLAPPLHRPEDVRGVEVLPPLTRRPPAALPEEGPQELPAPRRPPAPQLAPRPPLPPRARADRQGLVVELVGGDFGAVAVDELEVQDQGEAAVEEAVAEGAARTLLLAGLLVEGEGGDAGEEDGPARPLGGEREEGQEGLEEGALEVAQRARVVQHRSVNYTMSAVRAMRGLLVRFDFFPATQFLRYKGATEYRTATGGGFTLLVIALFCLLFLNALLDILDRKHVTLQTDTQHQSVPLPATLRFGPQGGFLFAVSINALNLSADLRYFDVKLQLNQFAPLSQLVSSQEIPLAECTLAHFNFSEQLARTFLALNGSNLLCPPLGLSLAIQGKVTSEVFRRFTLTVGKCSGGGCASAEEVQLLQERLGYFGLGVVLLNTQLNPTLSKDYQQYYLEEKNFFPFTTSLAVKANAEVEEYRIQTDQSILPFQDTLVETGVKVGSLFQHSPIPVLADTYAVVHFEKSSTFVTYTRAYQKIDTLLAYVGGLIGTILGLIFVLHSYNELCYQLSLASRLYRYDDEEDISPEQFNFLYYLGYLLHRVFNRLPCCKHWGRMTVFTETQEEIEKQLDVSLLMKKIIFFERTITAVAERVSLNPANFLAKTTLYDAKHSRIKYEETGSDKTDATHSIRSSQEKQQTHSLNIRTEGEPYGTDAFEMANFRKGKLSNYLGKELLEGRQTAQRGQQGGTALALRRYHSSQENAQAYHIPYPLPSG